MNYTILILDDDNLILDWLSTTIKNNYPNIETICFDNYDKFLSSYDSINYDIVITDIVFGKVNSIKVYNKISKNNTVPLIYMSGNDTRTFDVYDTPHIYFLAKPIDEERLKKSIDRATTSNKIFTFDYFKKSYYLNFDEIMYFESDKRIIHIITKNNIYQTYGKLDEIASRIPNDFVRISKSFLVNKKYISTKNSQEITLINGEKFSISRSMKKDLENVL